jgi:hypothetical protein
MTFRLINLLKKQFLLEYCPRLGITFLFFLHNGIGTDEEYLKVFFAWLGFSYEDFFATKNEI